MYKHSNLSDNPTTDEIRAEIDRLKSLKSLAKNEEQGLKILLNSFYGALGFTKFTCYNSSVAQSVTLQGQEQIKYMGKLLNKYFREHWHKDKKAHEYLQISNVVACENDVLTYIDTDSNYVSLDEPYRNCQTDLSFKDFAVLLYNYRLTGIIERGLMKFAERYNAPYLDSDGKPYQEFELETISHSGLWLRKKKYALDLWWMPGASDENGLLPDGGIEYESGNKIKITGLEIVKGDTPKFVREKLKDMVKFIIMEKGKLDMKQFVGEIKKIKDEYKVADVNDICITKKANGLEKYILDDKKSLEFASKTPIQIRAAGTYNYMLGKSKYGGKYQRINSGDKIKYYYVDSNKSDDVFAFLPGSFPVEFAPEIDYDYMFKKVFIDPINRFITAMGYKELNQNLAYFRTLI